MSNGEQNLFTNYFADETSVDGIKQIKNISIESITYVDNELATSNWLTDEYPLLLNAGNIETYIIGLNCSVSTENQYFYNGLNYFLVVLIQEAGGMKIVQFNRPNDDLINSVIVPQISISDENYIDEVGAVNAINSAEQGFLIDGDGNAIENGFETITVESAESEGTVTLLSNNYSEHPALKVYTNYSVPSTIRVKMSSGTISKVGFDSYVKNTINNEWMGSWHEDAVRAGVYCVKGVGLYRSIKPVNSSAGYDVSQVTQNYKPNTSSTSSNTIIDNITDAFMVNSDNKVFFPEYGKGTSGSGRVLQYGTQYLASKKGYSTREILNYYYKDSDCSSDGIKFVEP